MNGFIKPAFTLLFLLLVTICYAQEVEISGKISDDTGETLPGASVVIKGTTIGTISDIDGNYKIKASPLSIIVFSYIGMQNREEKVQKRRVINIKLSPGSISLDEIVAVGYGTSSRKDLTGSVASLRAEDIAQMPTPNLGAALAGKIAGVQIGLSSGAPDADMSIRIRGGASITQSNEPLYVIDGFPTEDGMRGIDPSDIASIDVLKDASSTSIYGARGANGVIIITTKSGKEGKNQITFDAYVGPKYITKELPVLGSVDYTKLEYERALIGGPSDVQKFTNVFGAYNELESIYGNRPGINWQDEVFKNHTTLSQMYKVGANGGFKSTNYNLSYTNNQDGGIMAGSGLTRNSFRLKVGQQLMPNMTLNTNLSYTDETSTGLGSLNDNGYFSRMQHIVQYRPVNSKDRPDSELLEGNDQILVDEGGNQMISPIISIEGEDRKQRNRYLSASADLQWKIFKIITYKGSVGMRNRDYRKEEFYSSETRQAKNSGGAYGSIDTRTYETFSFSNTFTINPKLKRGHRLDVMVGQEYLYNKQNQLISGAKNFPDENFGVNDMSLAGTPDIITTNVEDNYLLSFFARANYQLMDRYLFSASIRADGSSKFGPNNKWGIFPAASFAWRASEEEFIKEVDAISNLKARLSFGTAGNDRISNYASLSLLGSSWTPTMNNATTPTFVSTQLPNPNLKWETIISTNLGFDLGFFNQRLQITLDLYSNTTKDLLIRSNLPNLSAYSWRYQNIGQTNNMGIELAISSVNIKTKSFEWSTSFNISSNKNTVLQLNGVDYFTTKSGWCGDSEFSQDDYIIKVGESMGNMYGYKLAGIYTVEDFELNTDGSFKMDGTNYVTKQGVLVNPNELPKPGSWKFEDTDHDNKISASDKTILGNSNPIVYGGMNNTFIYKGIDLSIFFNFSIGNKVYNANKMYYTKMTNKFRNAMDITKDRFYTMNEQGENIMNDPAQLAEVNKNATMASIEGVGKLNLHSGYIEDASFLRISNISLGYSLPKPILARAFIQNLRIYATAYNIYTFTGYSGFDPEVNSKPNGNLTPGVDWGAYPRAFSFVVGLNLTFQYK